MNGQERNKQSLEVIFSARDDSRKPIKSNAYTDGYDAYYNRLEKSDNPYFKAANPIEQQEWERGWEVAERDYMSQLFAAQEEDEMLYNSRKPIKSALKIHRDEFGLIDKYIGEHFDISVERGALSSNRISGYTVRDKNGNAMDLSFMTLSEAKNLLQELENKKTVQSSRKPIKSGVKMVRHYSVEVYLPFTQYNNSPYNLNGIQINDWGVRLSGSAGGPYAAESTNIDIYNDGTVSVYDTKHHLDNTKYYNLELIHDFLKFFRENIDVMSYLDKPTATGMVSLSSADTYKIKEWADAHKSVQSSHKPIKSSRKPIKSDTYRDVVIAWSDDFPSQEMASLIRDKFDISVSYFIKDGDFAIAIPSWNYNSKILNFIKRKVDVTSLEFER